MDYSGLKIYHNYDSLILRCRKNINKVFAKEFGYTFRLRIK